MNNFGHRQIELVARAIYMTHRVEPTFENEFRGSPTWENASDNVRDWVRAQAVEALRVAA